jgi:hypothetical protein
VLEVHRTLPACRRNGGAENIDVAAPSAVVVAITFCVPSGRMTESRHRAMAPDLRAAARDLWAALEPLAEEESILEASSGGV